jgi:hypothetical protein
LESDTPTQRKVEESQEDKSQDDSTIDEVLPEIIADSSEEAFQAETRPIQVKTDDLNSVFQSVLASPSIGRENIQKPEPGSKPNLIEETLTFMAHTEGTPETLPTLEPVTGEILQQSRNSTDH